MAVRAAAAARRDPQGPRRQQPRALLRRVNVAVIGAASSHLAGDISVRGVTEFAIVFAIVWFAWFNGSLFVELHGREDGRTRLLVFLQMGILALLAVFTTHVADARGASSTAPQYALVYAAFLAVMTWQWWRVRELDRTDRPEYLRVTFYYVAALLISTVVVAASAALPADARLEVWAGFAIAWLIGITLAGRARVGGLTDAIQPTESLVERFGAFTIIVLGEVILGVVSGLRGAELDALAILTGMLALVIGLAILSALWFFAVAWLIRAGSWGAATS